MNINKTVTGKRIQVKFMRALNFCCMLLIFSCTKEKESERSYPRVVTGAVTNIHAGGATFNGSFLQSGNSEVIDHGFVFDTKNPPSIQKSEKISLGASNGSGSFTATPNFGLEKGKTYYVSAYARNKDKIFYAEPVDFYSQGGLPPEILEVVPSQGVVGDTVTIKGKYFSSLTLSSILLEDYQLKINSITQNEIIVIITDYIPALVAPIVIVDDNRLIKSDTEFEVISPWKKLKTLPMPGRIYSTTYSDNGYGYVCFGFSDDISSRYLRDCWKYNRLTDTWQEVILDKSIRARYGALSFQIKNQVFIGFGKDDNYLWDFYQINQGHWMRINNENYPISLGAFKNSFVVNDLAYVCGELDFLQFNPALNEWTNKTIPLPSIGGWNAISFSYNNHGYVGHNSYYYYETSARDIWEYDVQNDKWNLKSNSFPGSATWGGIAFVINDRVFIGLGRIGVKNEHSRSIWEYFPEFDLWKNVATIPAVGRSNAFIFLLENKAYIGSGYIFDGRGIFVEKYLNDFYEFDPSKLE